MANDLGPAQKWTCSLSLRMVWIRGDGQDTFYRYRGSSITGRLWLWEILAHVYFNYSW